MVDYRIYGKFIPQAPPDGVWCAKRVGLGMLYVGCESIESIQHGDVGGCTDSAVTSERTIDQVRLSSLSLGRVARSLLYHTCTFLPLLVFPRKV